MESILKLSLWKCYVAFTSKPILMNLLTNIKVMSNILKQVVSNLTKFFSINSSVIGKKFRNTTVNLYVALMTHLLVSQSQLVNNIHKYNNELFSKWHVYLYYKLCYWKTLRNTKMSTLQLFLPSSHESFTVSGQQIHMQMLPMTSSWGSVFTSQYHMSLVWCLQL